MEIFQYHNNVVLNFIINLCIASFIWSTAYLGSKGDYLLFANSTTNTLEAIKLIFSLILQACSFATFVIFVVMHKQTVRLIYDYILKIVHNKSK